MSDYSIQEYFESYDWDFAPFCREYNEFIRLVLLKMRIPSWDVDDVAQLVFLEVWQQLEGWSAQPDTCPKNFQGWLMRVVRNKGLDYFRRKKIQSPLDSSLDVPAQEGPGGSHSDDCLYALGALTTVFQRMKSYCTDPESNQLWTLLEKWVFSETVGLREKEYRERTALEISPDLPRDRALQKFDNLVTRAKRLFHDMLPSLLPRGLARHADPHMQFVELLGMLSNCDATESGGLAMIYRTTTVPGSEIVPINSLVMLPGESGAGEDGSSLSSTSAALFSVERPEGEWSSEEKRFWLRFRLEMPMEYYLESVLNPKRKKPGRSDRSGLSGSFDNVKSSVADNYSPISLAYVIKSGKKTLVTVPRRKLIERLVRLKEWARWMSQEKKDEVPEKISKVLYYLAIVLAKAVCDETITGLRKQELLLGFRWVLRRRWLDERLEPVFRDAITQLATKDWL